MEKDNKELEIVMGDNSFLEFSDVGDCVNTLRPKNKTKTKKVIIPKTQEERMKEKNKKAK